MLSKKLLFSQAKKQEGYVALISVLIIAAVSLAIATSVLLLGVDFSRSSFAFEQSNQAKGLANACAEQGLQEIRNNILFSGTGNLSLGSGNCDYNVINIGDQNRTITGIGNVGSIVRKIKIETNAINPQINIVSWQEVADI